MGKSNNIIILGLIAITGFIVYADYKRNIVSQPEQQGNDESEEKQQENGEHQQEDGADYIPDEDKQYAEEDDPEHTEEKAAEHTEEEEAEKQGMQPGWPHKINYFDQAYRTIL